MKSQFSKKPNVKILKFLTLAFVFLSTSIHAQLDNPDWGDNATSCVTDALLYPGVAVVTCGVVEEVPASGRYVIAYMAMNNAIPTSTPFRDDITDPDSVLHSSDWLVSNIGNVFGTAINQRTAEVFVTSSSNYGAGFGFTNNSPAVLNYGVVGSPANATEAAGTVYRIDPITGAVTVFVRLPQQTTTLEHWDCEDDRIEITRSNTGVGLGNITYDEIHDQFFVSNTEDGRIYRISNTGTILDSYDPLNYDSGVAGIDDLEDIPYGLAVEPGGNRLFYGVIDDPGAGPAGAQALPGAPKIYSVDLDASGGFVGSVDNSVMPSGATYDNYIGTDVEHGEVPTSIPGGGFSYTNHTTYFISDMTFAPDGTLLVAVRTGCFGSWHSSYNHWAETDVIALNTTTNLYDTAPVELDVTVFGDAADDDTYGGVATYELKNATCDVQYATSAGDVLSEVGPHGIAIWDSETTNSPLSPLGVFEYGVLPNEDPKGVGGDVEMYNSCANSCNITGDMVVCEGQNVILTYTPDCSSALFTWQITAGDATIVGADDETTVTIMAGTMDFTATLIPTNSPTVCTFDVAVTQLANPNITAAGPYCVNDVPVTLSASPAGGTFSGPGITNGATGLFDPATAGVGTHTITYSIPGICMESATTSIIVNGVPTVSVSGGPFCVGDAPTDLTGSPMGGTFSGDGITDASAGTFDPATAGVGTHTITYTFTDGNNCTNSNTVDIEVFDLPLVFVSGGPFCVGDAPADLTGSPMGGTFSGDGITDASAGTFDPSTAGVGTHTITYVYTDGNNCTNSNTVDVEVFALPTVTVSGGPFCVNEMPTDLTGSPAGGTFSGDGITDASAGTFDPSIAGVGTHTVTYTFTDGNNCTNSNTVDIEVFALPIVTVSGGPFCVNAMPMDLMASPVGGTFSGDGITDASAGTFDPSIAGVGTHTITYTFTDVNNCTNSSDVDVQVFGLPTVTVSGGPFCVNEMPTDLTGSPAGGTFSGDGITDASAGTFDPSIAGVGTHTITYTYTDGNNCTNSNTVDVEVFALPTVTVSGGPFCVNAMPMDLMGSPAGGTFSGDGITDASAGTFDPSIAGVGTHTITYTYTDGNNCTNSSTVDVEVFDIPIVMDAGGPYCVNDSPSNITGSPAGGTFSGVGITDASAGTFDPSIAGVGVFTITYTFTDVNNCTNSSDVDVEVFGLPTVMVSGGPFCLNEMPTDLIGSPAGGTFSGDGITDASAGTFDPAIAGAGTHTITYTFTDGNNCTNSNTVDVEVFALPSITVSGGPFCIDAMPTDLTGSPAGGTFSGDGITDASAGTFDPVLAGVGIHTITYTFTDGNNCTNSNTTDVEVLDLPIVTVSGGPFCIDEMPTDLIGSPTGGTFSGDGITDASAGTFDPATAGVGTHTITYTFTDGNNCTNSNTTDIEVLDLPIIAVSGGPFCIDEMPTDLTGSPAGGTFSGDGIIDASAGTFDPSIAGIGTHTITYTFTDGNNCTNGNTVDIEVFDLPTVTVSGGPFCINEMPTDLTGTPVGGTFSGDGITDASAGTFDPAIAGIGIHTITYVYTDGNNCTNSNTVDIEVFSIPTVTVNGGPFCINEMPTDLMGSPTGGTFSGDGITDASAGTFDPSIAGVGTHTITYTYTDGNNCTNSNTVDVEVFALPTVTVSGGPFCVNAMPMDLMGSPAGGTFSGDGITDASAGTFDPSIAGVGTHTITYTYTDGNNCTNSSTVDVDVFEIPVVMDAGGPYCVNDSPSNITGSPAGGTFSGVGVTDASAGTFDPSIAGVGVFTITYTFTDVNNCTNSSNVDVEVFGLPTVTVSGGPFCIDEMPTDLVGSPTGGTFSGDGITDTNAGTFDPATAGVGTHTITYTFTDGNNCTNSNTVDIEVNDLPTVAVSGGPFCIDAIPMDLVGSPTGGTFSGDGITDASAGTFDPAIAGVGMHTITYTYTDGNNCTNSNTTDIEVFDLPTVTVSGGPFCVDEMPTDLVGSPTGGTFSGDGIIDATAGTFDPGAAGVGTHTITYVLTDRNNCTNSNTVDVEVFALPTVTVSGGPFCIDAMPTDLVGSPTGGTFSGDGITDATAGTFDPAIAGVGTHTITYTFTDGNNCTNSNTVDVEVFALPTVTVSGGPFCLNEPSSNLTGTPVGGTFSGDGITDSSMGTFSPIVAGVGIHTITYTFTDGNNCTNSATVDVEVFEPPMVSVSGGPFCINEMPSDLVGTPTGGTFNGSGIVDASAGTFDPAVAGIGTHTIRYDIIDSNGCRNSAVIDVVVNDLPILTLTGGPFCEDNAPGNLAASPAGGTFSGDGITDSSAGTFDPAVAGVGTHLVTYEFTDTNGCTNSISTNVIVNPLPIVDLTGGAFCIDDSPVDLGASPMGGVFSGDGITDSATGTFDPATAGVGVHVIRYDFEDSNGCLNSATANVEVFALPTVTVSGGPFCIDEMPADLAGTPTGGTFSGDGITDALAGTFDPAIAGVGTHIITYTFTDGNNCTNSNTVDVEVFALPTVTVSGGPFCVDAMPTDLVGSPIGGMFSGDGITDATAGTFDPATAGVGTHTITYTFTDGNNCTNSNTVDVEVFALPTVTVSGGPFCIDAMPTDLTGSPAGGTFSGDGITDNTTGTFDPSIAGVGTHTITYTFTDGNNCTNSNTVDVEVFDLPIVTVSGGPFCIDAMPTDLIGTPMGGTFSGDGITDASAGTFDPSVAGIGTHIITYTFTDGNNCTNTNTVDINVFGLPAVTVFGGSFCVDEMSTDLIGSPAGGMFSGDGIIDSAIGTFDPATAGVGTHTITYTYTDANNCTNSNTVDVEVFDLPTVTVSGGPFCIDDMPQDLTTNPAGGFFSGDGIVDSAIGTFDPAVAGVGIHTITYTFTDGNNCTNSSTVDIEVFALPVVNVTGGPFCIDEMPTDLVGTPTGGTFSGDGITNASTGTFDPATAGVGTHTITYTYTDGNNCTNSNTLDVEVYDLPMVSVTGGSFCIDELPTDLVGIPTGGTFSGDGITDATAGTFDPATAGVGTHTITYTFTDGNNCTNSNTADVEVFALPVVTVTGGPFCIDELPTNLMGTPMGGTFSGDGITDAITGTFDPATAGVGIHTITYTFTDGNNCTNSNTVDIEVFDLPVVTVTGGPFCIDELPTDLVGSPTGGTFSGDGITDSSTGTFNPATAGVGIHTITYTFTDGNNCTNSSTLDVEVFALPVVTISGGSFCIDEMPADLVGTPTGGIFSGDGITDSSTGTFDPATAGVGTHIITYTFTDGNNCTNSNTTDIEVFDLPIVTVSGGPFCIDEMPADLVGTPTGGTFSGDGITDSSTGTFDPATAGVGTHTITYTFTDGNNCTNSNTVDVDVFDLPIVTVNGGNFCIDDLSVDLVGTPSGGVFSGDGITDSSAGTFDPATAGVGTHIITYTFTDGNNCTNSNTTDIEVFDLPIVTVSGGPFCIDDLPEDLVGTPTGGTFSGDGITDATAGTFDPTVAGVGTHSITYTFTDSNGCTNSANSDIVVNALPVVTIDALPVAQVCIGNGVVTLVGNPAGGIFSGEGIIDGVAGTFDPKVSDLGVHTITYDYIDMNGCAASATIDIEVINCFDLALDKKLDPMGLQGPYVIGDEITFIITVYNQGQTDAIDVVVEDYLPSSMSFVSSPDFALDMGSYLATIPLLAAGNSQELAITLRLDNYNNMDVINNAEIIAADDDNDPSNPDPEDEDSDLDSVIGSSDDDSELDTDDDIDDEDPGQPGTMDNPNDEDDYDPTLLPILDLANTKTVDPASLAAAGGTFEPNEDIVFEINVLNQGNVVADDIVVTDTIPCGLSYDALTNDAAGWVLSAAGGSATFTVNSLAPGEDTTILITFNIKSSTQLLADCGANPAVVPGEPFTNYSYITSAVVDGTLQTEDVDSEFDSFTPEEANTNPNEEGDNDTESTGNDDTGSQDDNDPALVEIFDLALSKIVNPLDAPYKVGDAVSFEICVSNQGNVSTDSINIIDYIPAGLEYNTASDALGWTGVSGDNTATYSFESSELSGGTLDFGEQVCVDIVLTVLANQTDFINRSEITSATSIVDDGMGGTLTSLVTSDNDSSFDNIPENEAGGAADTDSDALTSDLDDPAVLGDGSGNAGDEVAATDDDSADPALVPIVDFALRKRLADGNPAPIAVGDTLRFLVEVLNQGNVSGVDIVINDYIPSNLAFVDVMDNSGWSGAAFGQSDVIATWTITNPLAPGEIDSLYIELEVLAGGSGNEDYTNLAEIFQVLAAADAPTGITPGSDISTFDVDSTPDDDPTNDNGADASSADSPDMPNPADDFVDGNGLDPAGSPDDGVPATDEDDADPALVAFHDVALTKTKPVDQEPVDIGEVVTFTITVHNQGSSALDSVRIIDYIPGGFSFVPNNNWMASGMNAILTATIANGLLPAGGIPAGSSQDFPLELTVAPTATLDNLVNRAEITGSQDINDLTQDDDTDSTADTISDNDAGGEDDTPSDDVVDGDGSGVPGDEIAETDEDDSDPEGVELALYSVGNQVWLDSDNSGTVNGTEAGIENVEIELYDATGMFVASTLTDDMGLYLFDSLVSGDYTVIVTSTNFNSGGALENLLSSTGSGQADLINGPNEDDINLLDPDTDVDDNDDNGVLDGNMSYPGAVASNTITLGGPIDEPLNEDPDNDPTTLDENENLTVDFGFVPIVSIGSNVFIDNNNDGIDDGDGGISGVTVEVYSVGPDMMIGGGDDVLVGFDVTDMNGDWFIDSLLPGDYFAVIPTPDSDYPISSTPTDVLDNGQDGNDNGAQVMSGGAVTSPIINLAPNEEIFVETNSGAAQDDADDDNGDMTVDFGFPPLMSIGSTVFYDQNDDGVQDLSDPLEGGIADVQVDLYFDADNNGTIDGAELTPIASVDTDSDGNYFFGDLLPGNYQVGVPTPDASAQNSSTGQNTTDNEDLTDDGDQATSGGATFSPIVNLEGGMEPNEDGANPGADQDDADELNGNMTVDFGFIPQMTIGSTVFYDPNDNGIQDTDNPLENGVEGIAVNLYFDADGDGNLTGDELVPVAMTTTDVDGNYFFDTLPEGDYFVGILPTDGAPVSSTGQMTADGVDGNDNGDQPGGSGTEILSNPVNLDGNMETHTEDAQGGDQDDADENNGDMTIDFGLIPNMSIGSTVFLDNNDDGLQDGSDPTETGIPNVAVELLYDANNDGVIDGAELIPVASTMTDPSGNYFFGNLPEGNYQVIIPTAPANAPTSSTPTDEMDNGEDGDDNGIQMGGAGTAVSSPIINLTANEEPEDDLETEQGGMQDNSAASPDENGDMTIDFGFIPYVSVGSNVFVDENNDGIDQGADEEGIEGVTIEVFSTGPDMMIGGGDDVLVGFDVTDINGDWLVDSLLPGEYYAVIDMVDPDYPTSSTTDFDADDAEDNNDNGVQSGGSGTSVTSNEFTLTGDAETTSEPGSGGDQDDSDDDNGDMTIDFGFVPFYSLGNQVWIDDNFDGLLNGGESGIDGVVVELYDAGGILVDMTVTMNGGLYLFDSLLPGDYIVVIPASELAPNGTLQDFESSTGTFNNGGPFETPGVDAETDTDNDDNGTFDTNASYPDAVVSTVVTLGGDEPLNEDPDNDPNTLDQYENLTVDFGFIPKVYDIALTKETDMDTGNKFGDEILFTISVTNQGNQPLTNIEVTDYIAPGFETVPALNSMITDAGGAGWVDNGTTSSTYVIGDVVAPNETVEIGIYLRLISSTETGAYVNFAEVSEFEDTIGNSTDGTGPYDGGIEDEDSTPDTINDNDAGGQPESDADDHIDGDGTGDVGDGIPETDEDDHDPAIIKVVDIALAKTVATDGPYVYGQDIEFDIEVTNQGNVDLADILISDYIPCGFIFADGNTGWSESAGTATYTIPALAAGTSTNVSLFLTVIPVSGTCEFEDAYTNFAEVSQIFADYDNDGVFDDDVSTDDIDSEADTDEENDAGGEPMTDSDDFIDGDGTGDVDDGTDVTDEDDHDPALITIFDLAHIKFIDDEGPYDVGEVATFQFEVVNQGNVDAFDIEVIDYLAEGFTFSPIGNDGWVESGDNLVYTIEGPLAPGETATFTLDLTVILPDNATIFSWYNESEISGADDDTNPDNDDPTDADSTPDTDPDNDNPLVDGNDDDPIFDPDDDNDNEINENPNDPFGTGDDDEDDNDAAGILVVGGLGDTVWKDTNGDGIQDPDEEGVEGVLVTLTDCEGNLLDTQMTDEDGFYFFNNLIPGDYQVQFDISGLPAGCTFTAQDQGGDDTLDSDVDALGFAPCTNIQGGEYDSTFDAGLVLLVNIGDFVWHDLDADGIQDPGEPGIEDVVVKLYNEDNELIQITMTDENGFYLFPNVLPDTYYIVFVDPEGFESTFPNTTDDANDSDITNFVFTTEGSTTDLFTIVAGQGDDLTFDAGYYICAPIGELVWYDVDEDDIWDPTENGINGLKVNLYRLNGGSYELFDETITGHKPGTPSDDGYFKFCAPPGTYYVEVIMPPIGLVQARANVINSLPLNHPNEPTNDNDLTNDFGKSTTASFTVQSGGMLCNIGAGFYPMATAGNRVWMDTNENGLQDEGEDNVANVVVEAYEVESGLKVAESTTNDLGIYKIEYLEKKEYYLKFNPPNGFGFTNPNTGDDDKDSDVDHSYGFQTTGAYSLEPGEDYINIDAGLRLGILPVVWTDVNAVHNGDHNLVSWGTASEVNTDNFVVERSLNDDFKFEAIGEVDAAGESTEILRYEFKDEDIRPGTYYYRIKQVDNDGKFEYSDIVTLTIKSDKNVITLAPNPAHDKSILNISLERDQAATVKVIGSDGRLIRTYDLESSKGEGINRTIELEDLPTGVYSIYVNQGTFTEVKKLIMLE